MGKDPSNHKYIRVEFKIDPIVREVIRIEVVDQIIEIEGQYGNNRPRQNYRDNNFQENTRGYGRQK